MIGRCKYVGGLSKRRPSLGEQKVNVYPLLKD